MRTFALVVALPFLAASCAQQSLTGDTYSRSDAGRAQNVQSGTITSLRYVKIEGNSNVGSLVGAAAGGILGNQIGSGSGRTAATVGGALAGGAAGSYVGRDALAKQGVEIQVRLDAGGSVSVVQEANQRETFNVGDRVRVLSGNGRTRVTY